MNKIKFKTNLDKYNDGDFPENFSFVPRIGEKVSVIDCIVEYYRNKKLPTKLTVVDVTHTESGVIIELWYGENDFIIADRNKVDLFS